MAASSSKRTTPARKKAKLDNEDIVQDAEASSPVVTPSRKAPRGKQAVQSSLTAESSGPAQDAAASHAEPETPVAQFDAAVLEHRALADRVLRFAVAAAPAEIRLAGIRLGVAHLVYGN